MPILRSQILINRDFEKRVVLDPEAEYELLSPGSFRGAQRGLGSFSIRVFDKPYDFAAVTIIPRCDFFDYQLVNRDYDAPAPHIMQLDHDVDRNVMALGRFSSSLIIAPTDVISNDIYQAEVYAWIERDEDEAPDLTLGTEGAMAEFADRMFSRFAYGGMPLLYTSGP